MKTNAQTATITIAGVTMTVTPKMVLDSLRAANNAKRAALLKNKPEAQVVAFHIASAQADAKFLETVKL